jgi:hypothetical protein
MVAPMNVVLSTHSISLDGFMARPDGKPGALHAWLFSGDEPGRLRRMPQTGEDRLNLVRVSGCRAR